MFSAVTTVAQSNSLCSLLSPYGDTVQVHLLHCKIPPPLVPGSSVGEEPGRHRERAAHGRPRRRRVREAAALGVIVDGPGEVQRLAPLPHQDLLPPQPNMVRITSPSPRRRRRHRARLVPRLRGRAAGGRRALGHPLGCPLQPAHQRRHRLQQARAHPSLLCFLLIEEAAYPLIYIYI
jgi:hypothetical protein